MEEKGVLIFDILKTKMSSYELINNVMNETFGVVFLEEEDDYDIGEYVSDSISFIQFILSLEDKLGCGLPDDFLMFDILSSARGFAAKIDSFLEENVK